MKKPEVGQTLYSLNIGNAARHRPQELTEVVVKKVGRKYFTCGEAGRPENMCRKYYIDDWCEATNYSRESELFETREEWEHRKESESIDSEIKQFFRSYGRTNLPLDDLRAIKAIIDKNTTEAEE